MSLPTAAGVLATSACQICTTDGGNNRVKYWDVYPAWNGGAWCMTFVQWCLKANGGWYDCPLPFYVPSVKADAISEGHWLSKSSSDRRKVKPGDLVVYGTFIPAHVGFFEKWHEAFNVVRTIEGNTSSGTGGSQNNGDGVYRRYRSLDWVQGFVSMQYKISSAGSSATPSTGSSKPKPKPGKVVGPRYKFPLPSSDYYFGKDDKTKYSVSGYAGRTFGGKLDRWWIMQFAAQLARRGWSVGKGKTWLSGSGNNGYFGNEYLALVKRFQKEMGLRVDGRLGPKTWAAAFSSPIK